MVGRITFQVQRILVFITLLLCLGWVDAYWRMVCGTIQTGRIDSVVSPGQISGHCHTLAGAINLNKDSNYTTLQNSYCTSCGIQADKSGYWSPQLYYRHRNGSYEYVNHDGTVVYYLGRGVNDSNIQPFPPGFRVLSGDSGVRAFDSSTLTYGNSQYGSEPIANRVSFACLDTEPMAEQPYMFRTNCSSGLRAQVHFQSCWDCHTLYASDQSHVAYMSGIDNGICPPTHPCQFMHMFFEVLYAVNNINQTDGGYFMFANGDTTGYGFHGDFINGWDLPTLTAGIEQCALTNDGSIQDCPPLAASYDPYFSTNCPEQPPQINESTKGIISHVPGCNPPTGATVRAAQNICPVQPFFNYLPNNYATYTRFTPVPGDMLGSWTFFGCTNDNSTLRPLTGPSYSSTNNMSIEACTGYCHNQGYPMAGLEYSTQCYCGTQLLPNNPLLSPLTCSEYSYYICSGNGLEQCGAPSLMQVWNDTSYAGPPIIGSPIIGVTTIPAPSGVATYYGCYSDAGTNHALLQNTQIVNTTSMSLELCGAHCQSLGYYLFGTEYSYNCFCGNSISSALLYDANCSFPCSGNKGEYCGAASKLSVWSLPGSPPVPSNTGSSSVAPPAPTPTVPANTTYLGCYSDSAPRVLTGFVSNNSISIDLCAAVAAQNNALYFGVEYSSQCLYGSTLSSASQLLAPSKCYMTCAGSIQICGGSNAISLYNNTNFVQPVIPNPVNVPGSSSATYVYTNCFSEGTGGRALGGNTANPTSYALTASNMTVEYCASLCFTRGFNWMGLENANECYCNNAGPINGAVISTNGNEDCGLLCAGTNTEFCGAPSKVQIYQRGV